MMAVVLPAEAARIAKTKASNSVILQVASTAKIAVRTNHSATLLDLKIGDHVSIAYDLESGALVAHQISDVVPRKPGKTSVNPVPASHHPAKSSVVYKHLLGIVQSVNVQASTLTIAFRRK
jgi:hypothetical protein